MTAFLESDHEYIRVDQILRVGHFGTDGGTVRAYWDGGQADFALEIDKWDDLGKGLPRFPIGELSRIATQEAKQAALELANVVGMYVGQPPAVKKQSRVVLQFQTPQNGKPGKYWSITDISTVDDRR